MIMRIGTILVVAAAALLFSGCATTRIVSEDPHADIYMNERLIGTGEAEVKSMGPPRTAHLEARRGEKVVGNTSMRRSFRFKTLLWGLCSYYTGLFWGWYYPNDVHIAVRQARQRFEKITSDWDDQEESVWMQPLNGE